MIRPAELTAIKDGDHRPRVPALGPAPGQGRHPDADRCRRGRGDLGRAGRAQRASAPTTPAGPAPRPLTALKQALAHRTDRPVCRVGLRYAGADPREALREQLPTADEVGRIRARLDRLDAASRHGPWTRASLELIDRSPGVRAPDLAAQLGRETQDFKTDVRKLKELGLTESLAIGYRLSPRGEAVLDHGGPPRERAPRPEGTPLPRTIGAPATGALRVQGVTSLEQVTAWTAAELLALHGVGPVAVDRLGDGARRARSRLPGGLMDPLRLGFVTGTTPDKWAPPWRDQRRGPLELVPVTEAEQQPMLRDGSLDMCLVRLPVDRDGCTSSGSTTRWPVVVVPRDHFATAAPRSTRRPRRRAAGAPPRLRLDPRRPTSSTGRR